MGRGGGGQGGRAAGGGGGGGGEGVISLFISKARNAKTDDAGEITVKGVQFVTVTKPL